MSDLKKLLDLLFLPGERCCPSDNKYSTHSLPIESLLSEEVTLVSPNQEVKPRTVKTRDLTLMCFNPMGEGFRNDSNVAAHRNFLFEIDVGSTDSQLKYREALEIPISAAIFSGNRSVHFLLCLEEALDEKTYRLLYQWTLNIATLFDQNVKTPSKSVRIPGAIRPETGKEQKLIEIGDKIKLEEFITWLNNYDYLRPKEREKRKPLTNEADPDNLSPWLRKALKENDIDFSKGRNKVWYSIFFDFAVAGYTQEQAEAFLENFYTEEHDFKRREWLGTAKSAYEHAIK